MNIYRHLAATDRPRFNEVRRDHQKSQAKMPREFVEISFDDISASAMPGIKMPIRAWTSRDFLVQLFIDKFDGDSVEYPRLTVNRTELTNDGEWADGISWDSLMRIKRELGFGECWAVEVFPPDEHFVNDANMRHLFIVAQPPFAWVKKPQPSQQ